MAEDLRLRIGIMGGTFNPVHLGHLLLAETAWSEAKLDRVLFIPSGHSYMKKEAEVIDAVHRLHMVELAIKDQPAFSASDIEIKRAGNTYTCDTLKQLQEEYRTAEFYFIMGADCLFSIENWHKPQEIFRRCSLLAAVRDGADIARMREKCTELKEKYQAKVKLLSFPETAISSTMIRERVKRDKSVRFMVPESVRLYMEENHLYQ